MATRKNLRQTLAEKQSQSELVRLKAQRLLTKTSKPTLKVKLNLKQHLLPQVLVQR